MEKVLRFVWQQGIDKPKELTMEELGYNLGESEKQNSVSKQKVSGRYISATV